MTTSGNLGSFLKKHNSQTPELSPSPGVWVCVPPESYQCYLCPTVNRGHLVWLLPVTDNFKHIRSSWLYLNVLIYIGHWYMYLYDCFESSAGTGQKACDSVDLLYITARSHITFSSYAGFRINIKPTLPGVEIPNIKIGWSGDREAELSL